MSNLFFDSPILNSPYEVPARHWELDPSGQPTQQVAQTRRRAEFITPIPKPRKQKGGAKIRMQADRLLGPEVADVDGNVETRKWTISVFNGPSPVVKGFKSEAAEAAAVGDWLKDRLDQGIPPQEIAIFVRSEAQIDRAREAAERAGLPYVVLDEKVEDAQAAASISVMHLAKGLEFRVVAVMGCDDEVIPLQERIEEVSDSSDLKKVYNTERHLLYVACTRARDQLFVSGLEPTSEFLEDIRG